MDETAAGRQADSGVAVRVLSLMGEPVECSLVPDAQLGDMLTSLYIPPLAGESLVPGEEQGEVLPCLASGSSFRDLVRAAASPIASIVNSVYAGQNYPLSVVRGTEVLPLDPRKSVRENGIMRGDTIAIMPEGITAQRALLSVLMRRGKLTKGDAGILVELARREQRFELAKWEQRALALRTQFVMAVVLGLLVVVVVVSLGLLVLDAFPSVGVQLKPDVRAWVCRLLFADVVSLALLPVSYFFGRSIKRG